MFDIKVLVQGNNYLDLVIAMYKALCYFITYYKMCRICILLYAAKNKDHLALKSKLESLETVRTSCRLQKFVVDPISINAKSVNAIINK